MGTWLAVLNSTYILLGVPGRRAFKTSVVAATALSMLGGMVSPDRIWESDERRGEYATPALFFT